MRDEVIRILALCRSKGLIAILSQGMNEKQREALSDAGVVSFEAIDFRMFASLSLVIRRVGAVRCREGLVEPALPE